MTHARGLVAGLAALAMAGFALASPRAVLADQQTSGCGQIVPPEVTGKTVRRHLASGGKDRTYLLHVPAAYDPARPTPLVLNFHGRFSSALAQNAYSGLVRMSERETFLVVAPDAVADSWLQASGVDDVAFTREIVKTLEVELCLDASRVFATGFSGGGFMATRLACAARGLVAAVAAIAGGLEPDATCPPVPILQAHGTADAVVPFDGGTMRTGGFFVGAPRLMAAWAKNNRCEGEPAEERIARQVRKVSYVGCSASAVHYIVEGGGHTWPGAALDVRSVTLTLGATTDEIVASELLWAFFKTQGKR
jgi:polyhydroxybutyrate depolymerase